jgi:hypothetical protein
VSHDDFQECAACARLPGSPTLCLACLRNRQLIGRLTRERDALAARVKKSDELVEAARIYVREKWPCKVCQKPCTGFSKAAVWCDEHAPERDWNEYDWAPLVRAIAALDAPQGERES